jgi:hypothetical protein
MRASALSAFVGAACCTCVLTGACAALTSMPPWLEASAGAAALGLSWRHAREQRSPVALAAATGVAAGLALPVIPPAPEDVIARPIGLPATSDLFALMDRIDSDPSAVVGHAASVSGVWSLGRGGSDATVSQRILSCCAADAVDVGFDVEPKSAVHAQPGDVVRASGIVSERMRDGEIRFALVRAVVAVLPPANEPASAGSSGATRR